MIHPYSKEQQLLADRLPSKAKRSEFTTKQRKEVKRIYGDYCQICMNPHTQIHHRKFRSGSGRNNPRNGAPLCHECHAFVHAHHETAEDLRTEAADHFGPYYYYDKYDCFFEALIDEPTDKAFEDFMELEERKAHENLRKRNGGAGL
ncbi:HNH endonuclease [Halobacillus aidingensis]|uniref:HNH endonuclease n=1 Tax=Halobacillus aidingensis TaxID=240303 RepID=A0A1H0MIH6_HALAD|nr:hypothetical protein [Halobacillus aidingensis]SDO80187.1 hypothetical protein SAMN05421677_10848 [Halobacillus aidingensis]